MGRRAGRLNATRSTLGRGALPFAIGAGLVAVAAHRHHAPLTRAVARVVVERPETLVVGAHLEAGPRVVGDGLQHDRDQLSERTVDARRSDRSRRSCPWRRSCARSGERSATEFSVSTACGSSGTPLFASSSARSASRSSRTRRWSAGLSRTPASSRSCATNHAAVGAAVGQLVVHPTPRRACSRTGGRAPAARGRAVGQPWDQGILNHRCKGLTGDDTSVILLVVSNNEPSHSREATMNPWIAGRIIETMQQEARKSGDAGPARAARPPTHRSRRQAMADATPRGPRRDSPRLRGRAARPAHRRTAGRSRRRPTDLRHSPPQPELPEQPMDHVRRNFDVFPLTPDRWADLEQLFGERGASSGCWCMWWRVAAKDWEHDAGAGQPRRVALDRERGSGAGTARLLRRPARRLGRRRATRRLPTAQPLHQAQAGRRRPGLVRHLLLHRPRYRGSGVAGTLLAAAVDHAQAQRRHRGGGLPDRPGQRQGRPTRRPSPACSTCSAPPGFDEIARRGGRPVLRRTL